MKRLSGLTSFWPDFAAKVQLWWKPFFNLLTFSLMEGILVPKKSLAVSIERGSLWVALGSKFFSKIKINWCRKYLFEEGRYPSPANMVSTLVVGFRELKVLKRYVTLSIPKEWIIIRTADLPSAVKSNIGDVVAYELDRLTPFSSESAYYDFKILSETEDKLTIIIVAARADLINQYLNALLAENIFVERVTVNLSGLGTLCSYMDFASDFICLDVDPHGYEGGFVRSGRVVMAFGGIFPESSPAEKAGLIAGGVGPAVSLARSLKITPTALAYTKGKDDMPLSLSLGMPVKALSGDDVRLKLSASLDDFSYNAVGAALESLWPEAKGFNILGKGLEAKITVPKAATLVLIILLLASWIPYVILPLQREQKRLQEINRQISIRKEEVKKVEALKKEVDAVAAELAAIDNFKANNPMSLVLLKELTTSLPKSVWLTRSRITETTMELEGYANSASEVLPKLEQSKRLKKVEFASPTIRDARANADRFVIKMELEGFAKEGADKVKDGETE
jgi:general secretion pathway protein L